jgi:hypothetical protein
VEDEVEDGTSILLLLLLGSWKNLAASLVLGAGAEEVAGATEVVGAAVESSPPTRT